MKIDTTAQNFKSYGTESENESQLQSADEEQSASSSDEAEEAENRQQKQRVIEMVFTQPQNAQCCKRPTSKLFHKIFCVCGSLLSTLWTLMTKNHHIQSQKSSKIVQNRKKKRKE